VIGGAVVVNDDVNGIVGGTGDDKVRGRGDGIEWCDICCSLNCLSSSISSDDSDSLSMRR